LGWILFLKYRFLHLYILNFFFQTWCIPLHTGSLVYYLAFPPLFLYEEDSANSSYHVLLQVFVYKYHKDVHKDCDIYTQRLEGLLINLNFQGTDSTSLGLRQGKNSIPLGITTVKELYKSYLGVSPKSLSYWVEMVF
jgi:hypothetical protein